MRHVILILALLLWAWILDASFPNHRVLMYAFFFAGVLFVGVPFQLLAASRKNMWTDLQVKPATIREKQDAPEEFWTQLAKYEPVLQELGYTHIESATLTRLSFRSSPSLAFFMHRDGCIVASVIVTATQLNAKSKSVYSTRLDLCSERVSGESLNTVSSNAPLLGPPPINQRFALIETDDLKVLHAAHSLWIRREGSCGKVRSSAQAILKTSFDMFAAQYIARRHATLDPSNKLQLTRRGFFFALLSIIPLVRAMRTRDAKQRGNELLRELTL